MYGNLHNSFLPYRQLPYRIRQPRNRSWSNYHIMPHSIHLWLLLGEYNREHIYAYAYMLTLCLLFKTHRMQIFIFIKLRQKYIFFSLYSNATLLEIVNYIRPIYRQKHVNNPIITKFQGLMFLKMHSIISFASNCEPDWLCKNECLSEWVLQFADHFAFWMQVNRFMRCN